MERITNIPRHQPRQRAGEETTLTDTSSFSVPADRNDKVAWKSADTFYREIVKRPDVRAILERLAKL
jgi:hypothetical protein